MKKTLVITALLAAVIALAAAALLLALGALGAARRIRPSHRAAAHRPR